jgi:hypothetical protein
VLAEIIDYAQYTLIKYIPAIGEGTHRQGYRAMIGNLSFWQAFNVRSLRNQRVAVAFVFLIALSLQTFDLHAELLFRSAEQVNGQLRWSPIRKYSNLSDTAYAPVSGSLAAVPVEEVRVFLSGEITQADLDSAVVMEGLLKSGKQKIVDNLVWFASNGGDTDTAMALGRLLRRLGIFTVVGKNDQCMSACVLAFMGGERRSVAGRLGIHRPYFPFTEATPNRPARFRHLQKVLKHYIEEMDFPYSLYEAVMLVPPESMQILTSSDLKRFYLEGISPSSEDIADAASARRLGLSMFDYLQRKAKAPACSLFDSVQGRCVGKLQEAIPRGGAAEEVERVQKDEASSAGRADSTPASRPVRLRKPSEANSRGPPT